MKKAVIYARFSSERQRDESIEDQVRVCNAFAEREGFEVVAVYADRALSGRTDQRPDFIRMVKDSATLGIECVIVYKLDRFSRDQYDAAIYKKQLAVHGVRVVSATENVPETPEGIILEKLLEGMAAYYSANLAQNVRRGMEGNAIAGKYTGDVVFGYRRGDDGYYAVDEEQAAYVREAFERYNDGEAAAAIARDFASRGVKTPRGSAASAHMLRNMLHNEKYIGVYRWGDIRIDGGMPAIIDRRTFDLAQVRHRTKGHASGHDYTLSGIMRCPVCGLHHVGTCGTSKTGQRYYYYRCNCGSIREDAIIASAANAIRDALKSPENVESIVSRVLAAEAENKAVSEADRLQGEADKLAVKRSRLIDAIEEGGEAAALMPRVRELSAMIDDLERRARLQRVGDDAELTPELLRSFLKSAWLLDDDALLVDAMVAEIVTDGKTASAVMLFRNEKSEHPIIDFEVFAVSNFGSPSGVLFELAAPCVRIHRDFIEIRFLIAA